MLGRMKPCCAAPVAVPDDQRRVLLLVLWINAAMFLIECGAGLVVRSTSLMADSVDMLGDALVYGFSLYVIRRGPQWQARAALLKGTVMAAFGVGVLAEVVAKLLGHVVPSAPVMGGVGLLALVANLACLHILWRWRLDDINMRSAWVCSRNDVLANGGVLLAAAGVGITGMAWPDIVIGLAIATMFGSSAIVVIRDAVHARRLVPAPGSAGQVTPRATPQA
jgi:Co/Zn/Cd efflux system component